MSAGPTALPESESEMTKHNTNNAPKFAVCHTNPEIVGDLRYVLQRDCQAGTAFGATTTPSDLRAMFRFNAPVKVLVIEQSIEPRETEQIWNEATDDPSLLIVVIARSIQDQERIKETDRRIVLGPDAGSTDILDAIRKLRVRRGQKAREAFETGVIWMDPATGRVRVRNRNVNVPSDEFKLLTVLADQPFRMFPKDELAIALTGQTAIQRSDIRYVEKVAHRLRHTLAEAHLDAVKEPAGLGFQLFPNVLAKSSDNPVFVKAAA